MRFEGLQNILKIRKGEKTMNITRNKEYLTPLEASEYTGVSKSQLAKLRYNGTGCKYIRIGDSATKAIIRYRKQDLDAWMESNLIRTTGGM